LAQSNKSRTAVPATNKSNFSHMLADAIRTAKGKEGV
jgi:hypothetical protein